MKHFRHDFPILEQSVNGHPLIYFDNAASSQKPNQVIEAIKAYYQKDHANVHRGIHELSNRATLAYESARERTAEFLHASSASDIIFTRGTTESINLVAHCLGQNSLGPGDKILITEMEHHSNMVPWQILASRTGATLEFIPVLEKDGSLDLSWLDNRLREDVKLLELCPCLQQSGHHQSGQGIMSEGSLQRAYSLWSMERKVPDTCPSMFRKSIVISMPSQDTKYVGLQVLGYSTLENQSWTPGRLTREGGEMIQEVTFERPSFKASPHRYEAGTPNMAGAVGLARAMDYIDAIGRQQIHDHDQALAQYFYDEIRRFPRSQVFGPPTNRGGLVSFSSMASYMTW